jgi:sec-independent protein translocase protein TatB
MFDIGWSELLLIGVVALIAIGPKELPGALRTLGQWMGKVRRMASEFQSQFHEAMREAELADLKKEVDEMATKAQSYAHFDPIEDIRKDIENAASPPPALDTPLTETPAPPTTTETTTQTTSATTTTETTTSATPQPAANEPAPAPPAEPASTTPAPANDAAASRTEGATPSATPDTGRAA